MKNIRSWHPVMWSSTSALVRGHGRKWPCRRLTLWELVSCFCDVCCYFAKIYTTPEWAMNIWWLKDPKLPVGKVIAIDKDYIDPLDGAHLFSFANINDPQTITKVRALLGNEVKANAVLSDMVWSKVANKNSNEIELHIGTWMIKLFFLFENRYRHQIAQVMERMTTTRLLSYRSKHSFW